MPAALVFDLDGTLIDSAPDIQAAVNHMLADQGQPALDLKTVTSFVGNGLPKLVERVLQHCNIDLQHHAALTQTTLTFYKQNAAARTRLYPGALPALEALKARGHPLGICTNKPEGPTRDILRAFALDPFFDAVIGGDTLAVRKPDPAPLFAAFEPLGGAKRIYVGDSEVDAETAARAKLPFFLFSEGYRKSPVQDLQHDIAFWDFAQLPDLIAGFVPA